MVIVWCDRCDQQPCDIITNLVIKLSTWQKYHSFPTCKREWIDKTQQWQESESYVATVNVDIDELLQVCSDFSTYSNISWYTKTFSCFFLLVQSIEDYINLSSRMAVMTEGRVACLSSPPVLMKKHGLGYTVVVAFQTDETVNVHSQMSFFTCAVETFTKVEVCLF